MRGFDNIPFLKIVSSLNLLSSFLLRKNAMCNRKCVIINILHMLDVRPNGDFRHVGHARVKLRSHVQRSWPCEKTELTTL